MPRPEVPLMIRSAQCGSYGCGADKRSSAPLLSTGRKERADIAYSFGMASKVRPPQQRLNLTVGRSTLRASVRTHGRPTDPGLRCMGHWLHFPRVPAKWNGFPVQCTTCSTWRAFR
jgi:hypothetical protein